MNKGTVKWFNAQKGYGFIADAEGKDFFVHQSNIQMKGFRFLNEGDVVDFEIGKDATGREQAVNVTVIYAVWAMRKEKQIMSKKNARRILRDGILNGMSVKKLIQMAQLGLSGTVEVMTEICTSINFFNCIRHVEPNESEDKCELISFLCESDGGLISATTIVTDAIDKISGCDNAIYPEDVIDVNILLVDETEVTIHFNCD